MAKSPEIRCLYDRLVPLDELKAHPKNRNKHPEDQIKRLAEILKFQGFRYPVKVSKLSGFVTSGHGRIEAARLNGWKKVPVNFQDYDSDEQEYADVQADNAIAAWAELDLSGINTDLGELGPDFDINMLGLKDFEIEPADKLEPQCDEDEVPEAPEEPKTKLGDIYKLGRHRLMCGDSTSIDAVEKLMNGEKAEICFTSPPYNAGRKPLQSERQSGGIQHDKYNEYRDDQDQDQWLQLVSDSLVSAMSVSSYQFFNVQHLAGNKVALIEWLHQFRSHLVDTALWDKGHAVPQMAEKVMGSQFEYVFIFSSEENPSKAVTTAQFDRGFSNVYSAPRQTKNEFAGIHAATFPVHLPEYFLMNFTSGKGQVLDLFGGTGTTLVAAEKTNRTCFMMELDPHYCDVIVARWEKYTGQKAELISG